MQRKSLIIACSLLVIAGIASVRVATAHRRASQQVNARAILVDLYINPRTLAASGVDVGHGQSIVDAAMKCACSPEGEELKAAATAYEDSGRSEQSSVRVRKALDDCFVSVTRPLPSTQKQTLSNIRRQVEFGLPPEYITVPRTDTELATIKASLNRQSTDKSMSSEMESVWNRIRNSDAVIASKANVEEHQSSLLAVWNSAFPRVERNGQDVRPWWERLW